MSSQWKSSAKLAVAVALAISAVSAHAQAKRGELSTFVEKPASASKAAGDLAREPVKFMAPLPDELVVSDRDFNHFVFPEPVAQIVFPAGASLKGKPTYLAGNTQVLIQLARGSNEPVQMVAETESGAVHKFYLRPQPINGTTHRVAGARDPKSSAQPRAVRNVDGAQAAGAMTEVSARLEDIDLIKMAERDDLPSNFEAISLPRATKFDKFTVVPLRGFSDGVSKRVMVFNLVASPGQTAVVAPPQFYRPGITAVMIDADHVSDTSSPLMYVVEDIVAPQR